MNIVLGFGSIEKEFAEKEKQFVVDFVRDFEKANKDTYFNNDDFVKELKEALSERSKKYKDDDEKYNEAKDFPERYSYYYFTILTDMFNVVVIFEMFHINRRHPMSPDGWALMQTEEIVRIKKDY